MHKGKLISFEGSEKSGKSTQARLLIEDLQKKGYETLFLREPGSTRIGEKIRTVLLDIEHNQMTVMTELFLYMAARVQLVEEIIKPALQKGIIVLCDRFLDSTLAYQGFGSGLDLETIKKLSEFSGVDIQPDLTIVLDSFRQAPSFKHGVPLDRIESRSRSFHQRVKRGYLELAQQEPKRIKVIKVQKDLKETQKLIREVVEQCLFMKSQVRKAPSRS